MIALRLDCLTYYFGLALGVPILCQSCEYEKLTFSMPLSSRSNLPYFTEGEMD